MESSKNTRNNVADTLLPSSSTIFKLQATKNIKLVKSHCIFYDLLIKREIKKIVNQPTFKPKINITITKIYLKNNIQILIFLFTMTLLISFSVKNLIV